MLVENSEKDKSDNKQQLTAEFIQKIFERIAMKIVKSWVCHKIGVVQNG